MALTLRTYVGRMEGVAGLPTLGLPGGATLPEVFARASAERDQQGDIRLLLDTSKQEQTLKLPGAPAYSLNLHKGLGLITGNRPNEPRVRRIGLLYADSYAYGKDVLGAMFDRGFATSDDPVGQQQRFRLPREGCAVFLGSIRRARGLEDGDPDSEDVQRQIAYTTIHELGHVFNLEHSSGRDYMVSSSSNSTYPEGYFGFSGSQSRWLSDCSRSRFVWPGGSPFGMGPSLDQAPGQRTRRTPGLSLMVGLSRTRIWPWEPVELELTLALSASAHRGVRFANEFDPGYRRLRIWIESPEGERRLYRSPRHYCGAGGQLQLKPGERFRRDISLFGQSGGLTFQAPGEHKIWAEWEPGSPARTVAKPVSIEVMGPGGTWPRDAELMGSVAALRVLYYRRGDRRSSTFRALEDYARQGKLNGNTAHAAYAVGRSHASSWGQASSSADRREAAEAAHTFLSRAAQARDLGEHARGLAEAWIRRVAEDRHP